MTFTKVKKELKSEKLDLVRTLICGVLPQLDPLEAHVNYFVTFSNDQHRKVWVYFMNKKSELHETFRKWKAGVENQTKED